MDRLTAAKLEMLKAYETMVNKGTWVSWPDGNQYFVIRPEDFRELMDPHDQVLNEEQYLEDARKARMPPFFT